MVKEGKPRNVNSDKNDIAVAMGTNVSRIGDSEDIPEGRFDVRLARPRGYFNQRLGAGWGLHGKAVLS